MDEVDYVEQALTHGEEGSEFTSFCTEDMGHGRYEKREVFVTGKIDFLPQKKHWKGLKMIACVRSTRIYKGKEAVEKRY